jgi:hypothetical protein
VFTYEFTVKVETHEDDYDDNTYTQLCEQLDEVGLNIYTEDDEEVSVNSVKVEPVL